MEECISLKKGNEKILIELAKMCIKDFSGKITSKVLQEVIYHFLLSIAPFGCAFKDNKEIKIQEKDFLESVLNNDACDSVVLIKIIECCPFSFLVVNEIKVKTVNGQLVTHENLLQAFLKHPEFNDDVLAKIIKYCSYSFLLYKNDIKTKADKRNDQFVTMYRTLLEDFLKNNKCDDSLKKIISGIFAEFDNPTKTSKLEECLDNFECKHTTIMK